MSEINANIVVQPFDINITLEQPGITINPEVIDLSIYAVGGTNGVPAGNVGDLQYYAANGFAAIPSNVANYTGGSLNLSTTGTKIPGGVNGYFLQTDGAGNIDWAVGGGGGGNGTPGGSNTQIQYNDAGAFGGTSGFTFNEVSGNVAIPGALAVTGNISGTNANFSGNITAVTVTANLNGSATTASTVTANAQPNITSVGNLSGLQVIGVLNTTVLRTNDTEIALGLDAGATLQDTGAVALGVNAGFYAQGSNAIAISYDAGRDTQGDNSIAIGANAARNFQGTNSIAIGLNAGSNGQGGNSIAIGTNAGPNVQHANTIVLNATGANLNTTATNGFYVKPIRNATSNNFVLYDDTSGEVTYNSSLGTLASLNVTGNANVGNLNTTNINATGTTTLASTFVKPIQESVTIVGTAPGANYTYNLIDQVVVYNTANANANLTLNFRGNGSVTANTFISDANSIVATYLMTNGGTAYAVSAVNVDGNARAIKWAGNTVPNTYQNTIMSYTFNLIKTASNVYTVMGSATRYG
jgi:hypothetical protein